MDMEVVKINKKKKPSKKFSAIEPTESILNNNILRTITYSLIASISVLSMSFYFSEYSNSTTIRDVGLIFGIMVGIIPLTIHQLKEVQR
ncbi:MAG: type II secretion system F family protein, partial [Nitrosopumilus sp.]|nr:type II secretion system F family protein [Nitrosopumilus sp.]NNL52565.1 type II secretion system F family protein [Nitrosopumilus sp.]